jgi:hypothetical protein
MQRKIESKLVTRIENGIVTGPKHIMLSAHSLLDAFDPKLILQAIYQLIIYPDIFPVTTEWERLTNPYFQVMILEENNKLLYCDMHICTIPILLLKGNELFAFPGYNAEELCADKLLIKTIQNLQ